VGAPLGQLGELVLGGDVAGEGLEELVEHGQHLVD